MPTPEQAQEIYERTRDNLNQDPSQDISNYAQGFVRSTAIAFFEDDEFVGDWKAAVDSSLVRLQKIKDTEEELLADVDVDAIGRELKKKENDPSRVMIGKGPLQISVPEDPRERAVTREAAGQLTERAVKEVALPAAVGAARASVPMIAGRLVGLRGLVASLTGIPMLAAFGNVLGILDDNQARGVFEFMYGASETPEQAQKRREKSEKGKRRVLAQTAEGRERKRAYKVTGGKRPVLTPLAPGGIQPPI
jgi:hypothetical protein